MRLLLTMCTFSAVIAVLGAGGMYAGAHALESMDKIYAQDAHGVELLAEIRNNMLEAVVASSQMRSAPADQRPLILAAAQQNMRIADDSWRRFQGIPANPAAAPLRAAFQRVFAPAHQATSAYLQAVYAGDQAAMAAIDARIDGIWNAYVTATTALVGASQAQARLRYQDNVDFFSRLRLLAAGAISCGIVMTVLAYRGFVSGLLRPLDAAVQNCEQIAAGDLTAPLPALRHKSEIGRLMAAFAVMQRDLSRAVSSVKNGAAEINSATREIALGTLDLSQRTERQAAALETTSGKLNTLSASVRQNAATAGIALATTEQAGAIASQGQQAVAGVIGIMEQIQASATRMAQIVSVIEGISLQTKILALNAAVEAARAGTHGRGFAVVAGEVGVLAERAAAAAREIDQLIRGAGAEVVAGAEQARGAGNTMDRMRVEMNSMASLAADVAAASQRQTFEIGGISLALADIDAATQQNAALVEQVSAASAALASQSAALAIAVAVFKPLPEPAQRLRTKPVQVAELPGMYAR